MYTLIEARKKWCFMNIMLLNFMIQFFLSLLLLHGWLRPGASNDISLEIKDQSTSHFSLHVDHKHSTMFYAKNFCQGISLIFKVKNKIRCTIEIINKYWIYGRFWIFQVTVTGMYWYKFFCYTRIWHKTINFPCVLN